MKRTLLLLTVNFICSFGWSQIDTLNTVPSIFLEPTEEVLIEDIQLDTLHTLSQGLSSVQTAMLGVNFSVQDTLNISEISISINAPDGTEVIDQTISYDTTSMIGINDYQRYDHTFIIRLEEVDYLENYSGTLQLKYTDNTFSNTYNIN